jgi:hypothetical protein
MEDGMRTTELWIVIPRWDDFQHPDTTRTGNIPWVKNFTRLLSDDAYLSLTDNQRAVLHGLWLDYARSRGKVPENTAKLSRRLSLRVTKRTLEALNHAGFIEFSASSAQAELQAQTRRDKTREENALNQIPISPPTASPPRTTEAGRHLQNGANTEPVDEAALQRIATLAAHAAPDDIPF